jgi:hypothetical protein
VKNGRERSSALRGLREMERQVGSVRGTRWTAGLGAGHKVARRARRSRGRSSRCTVAVESRGLVGGRAEHAGFGGLPTNHRRTVSWFGPQNQVRRPNTTETGSGCVGKLRSGGHATGSHGLRREDAGCGEGVAIRWQDPQTLHKCPCVGCTASSLVRGSRVIYHTGGTRYISHECGWMALSLRDLGFHFPPPISHFPKTFCSPFLV